MKINGTGEECVIPDNVLHCVITNRNIYYTATDHRDFADKGLFRVKLDGSDRTTIIDKYTSSFEIIGPFIYYLSEESKYLRMPIP